MAIVEKVDGFFIPNVTLIGVGAAKAIPERIVYLNATKPLLVTDKGIVHTGILKQITDILDEAAMEYAIYDETVPNPTDLNVAAGVELYKKEECDSLISIGGGSSHDCCKGIGLVVSNGGKIHDYEGVDKSTKADAPADLAVNTTAGYGLRDHPFLHHHRQQPVIVKMAIVDWRVTPQRRDQRPAVLMVGMPPALTAANRYGRADPRGRGVRLHRRYPADRRLLPSWPSRMVTRVPAAAPSPTAATCRPVIGMCLRPVPGRHGLQQRLPRAHVHAMAHQLGGFYNLPHGECNAILLPIVEEYNLGLADSGRDSSTFRQD